MARLKGKVAIITGASGGIGAATAQQFLKEGAQVVLGDLDLSALKKVGKGMNPQNIALVEADVTKRSDIKKLVATAVKKFGGLDIMFANAGIEGKSGPLVTVSDKDFDQVINVNLKGVLYSLQEAVPALRKRGGGVVLMTSSVAGFRGSAGLAPYVTSKHAVIGLMRSAAIELGPDNIRVNTINPGPVDNRMMRSIEKQFNPKDPKSVKEGFLGRLPLGRYAQNEDVANFAIFLASDEAKYLTGQTFVVDGGYLA